MADRFYVNCALGAGPVLLQGAEAHHLATVRRFRPGDLVCLFNGDGREYPARVTEAGRKTIALDVLGVEAPARELSFPLALAAPLPKGDRAQFLVEKLTELGATSFVPLRTRRSVVHPGESRAGKLERYVIEASKQCGRNVLLRVEPLAEWEVYCRGAALPRTRILAHPGTHGIPDRAGEPGRPRGPGVSPPALSANPGPGGIALAVGPEGGFTDEEVATALAGGWQVVGLGPRILRVETAALALTAWASVCTKLPPSGRATAEG